MSLPDPLATLDARVSRCPLGHWQFDGICKACDLAPETSYGGRRGAAPVITVAGAAPATEAPE